MTENTIIDIIREISGMDIESIKKSQLIEDGILDSFSLLVLISEIEKKENISLNMDNFDINDFKNIHSIISYIEKNRN